ncbi:phytoene desaturase family protein [Myxococcus eversor]|uniref:phytoene desaturase family protein n=1 Tax=Myxococcus eversor TaxID=2709661 RepID=UPI0013D08C21|nr:NAD(P)/FAD-dependent oxidoreductase [Myxococcus eversor]
MNSPSPRGDASASGASFDAIFIGSGIGCLGAAAVLARHGMKVLVLEQHSIAGGMTHTFRRKGYEWDVGVHCLGKVHDPNAQLRQVFDFVTDGALGWARMAPVYDRLVFSDRSHDFIAGAEAFQEELGRAFPSERKAIATYLGLLRGVERASQRYFIQHVLPRWMTPLTYPVLGWPFRRHSNRTTGDVLRSLTSDSRLLGVLTGQWGNYALPPGESSFAMHALMAEYYLEGGCYPVGGAGSILDTIAPVITRAGGQLRVRAEVKEILVRDGRALGVRLTSGEELLARHVISGAGAARTLGVLLPERWRPPDAVRALQRIPQSIGHLGLYLGLRGSPEEVGLPATNVWVHAGYDHDANLRAFRNDASSPLPVVYLSSSSARDPAWTQRHPGRSTLTAVCPAPYSWFERWEGTRWHRRGPEYEALKAQLTERLLSVVFDQFPQLRGRVEHQELSTPLSTAHFAHRPRGSIYGLEHSPERFRQPWLRSRLPIRDLLLVGQDAVSVGVGASLMSGVLAASVILRRNVLGDIERQSSAYRRAA